MIQNILAKPHESLIDHVDNCLKVWEQLKLKYSSFFPDPVFWQKSLLTVIFHDIGKVIDSFQQMMIARRDEKPFDYNLNFRHELFSGGILAKLVDKDILPVAAVYTHHNKLNLELFDKDEFREVSFDKKHIIEFVEHYQPILKGNGITIESEHFYDVPQWTDGKQWYNVYANLIWRRLSDLTNADRTTYVFYKGIMQTSDWFGSAHEELRPDLPIKADYLKEKIEEKEGKPIQYDSFQIDCSKIEKDCLAIAPTGAGKTEAALLWAGEKSGKIIYLLPTRVTTNAIYERLKEYFSENNVGLVHSTAVDYHRDENDRYEGKDYLLEKTFHRPLTVATIDQLLITGFNVGFWAMKELNCVNAKVIIDEVHAYDFYTLGLTIAMIRHLKELGCSFFLMSATVPKFLKQLIFREIPHIHLVEHKALMGEARNRFYTKDCTVDDLHDKIVKNVTMGKKVLIVVNTVNEAIRLYEKYKDLTPICYHSRFMVKDRKAKEKSIIKASKKNNGCLAITTQVVEVSLDIDFDVIYTENAPADAIIQRAGRVNRKREKENTSVIIFNHQEITERKIYDRTILNCSFNEFKKFDGELIKESEFIGIIETVYKEVDIESTKEYKEGLSQYQKIQEHYRFIEDVLPNDGEIFTRIRKYLKISVIPAYLMEELNELKRREKSKYSIDVPYYVKSKYNCHVDKDGLLYCELDYNFDRGAKIVFSDSVFTTKSSEFS
ncbi:MAG: CRISPR-associated helicase Cas3' [Nitrosopumilus sp.]